MARFSLTAALFLTSALTLPTAGAATTITGWITDNVVVGEFDDDPTDDVGGASVIYDRDVSDGDTTGATTYGKIVYIAPESNTPGIKIDTGDPAATDGIDPGYVGTKKQVFDGCIMASSTAFCDSEFQSGKRIKQQVTGIGPIDLTFGLNDADGTTDGDSSIYQVFHRLINVTGGALSGFTVELGRMVDGVFVQSTAGDGLGFAQNVEFGPDDLPAFSQYPFGLFGGADNLNPNPLNLPGFFDTTARSGLDVALDEDVMTSGDYYGKYPELFTNWLSQEDVPLGLLYDYDPGKADPLVMAWAGETGWEFLRGIDPLSSLNDLGVVPIASKIFAYDYFNDPVYGISADMFTYLDDFFPGLALNSDLLIDFIEDLANLNLTFAISVDDRFQYDSFTMRVTTIAPPVAPIPLPAGAVLMLGALAALGFGVRKGRSVA